MKPRWLLLIHQIPPKPDYLRVKIWRRLQRVGAVAIKSSVYALPAGAGSLEDLQWVMREVVEGGGDASIVEARFVDGLSDDQVRELFQGAREAEYAELEKELGAVPGEGSASLVERARRKLAEIAARDFFSAPGRQRVEEALRRTEARGVAPIPAAQLSPADHRGRTWVTRTGIHVDRMASAWLIRRFIDPKARFRFVSPKRYRRAPGELRFDMFGGEFTHEGDRCTFEALIRRFGLQDPALRPLAELVHDIDLKDGRYGRAETAGLEQLVTAIAMAHRSDEARLERASAVLDDLYELFRRKRA
ncbi:MAG TPA: chromate resistance protein ChrB domain-containing protein [Myxococcaceae bacterium]